MIFVETRFLLFFAVCFTVHWLLPGHRPRKLWLLLCSYFFYGSWDYRFLALLGGMTCIDYVVALALEKRDGATARKLILCISLVGNLGVLGFFKYYDFFVESGVGFLHLLGVQVAPQRLDIVLPVGISFITFQTLSYTIDVYRRELAAERNPLDFALFVAFFPQLVAGPIVRAREFLPQLAVRTRLADVAGRQCLLLFLVGFFKKACLADNIAPAIDPVFADPAGYGGADTLLAAFLYSVQIYCDFSGYSDMAIGVAGMLGYRLPRNFDFPYFSRSVQEFWRRWHISLSTWLRDYLYVSLGGNRGTRWTTARNLLLTMLLGGLWHGANLTFVVWGLLHGVALLAHRELVRLAERRPESVGRARRLAFGGTAGSVLAWALTLGWVVALFALFRAPTFGIAHAFFRQLGAFERAGALNPDWWILLVCLAFLNFVAFRRGPVLLARLSRLPEPAFYFAYGAACAVVPYFMPVNTKPFIYFQF